MNREKFLARNHALNIPELKRCIIRDVWKKLCWWSYDVIPYGWRMWYYEKIKPIFAPQHKRLRKFIPRTWTDMSYLFVELNFEMVKIFYEEEYSKGIVDWEADELHSSFAKWLEEAYVYITRKRKKLQELLTEAYPESRAMDDMFKPFITKDGEKMYELVDDGVPYDVKYAEVNRIEALIDEQDTKLLTEIIAKRDFFWT